MEQLPPNPPRPGRAPTGLRRRGDGVVRLVLAAVVAVAASTGEPAAAARSPYEQGEIVRVSGRVSDGAGRPLTDLEVVLEASRTGFSFRQFGKSKRDIVRGAVRTDARGDFGFEFPWNWRYNHFEIIVAVPVQEAGAERLQVLERRDVTRQVLAGSPVSVPIVLTDTSYLGSLRDFLAALETADEKRTYEQMGRPDRVDRVAYPDRTETSWWYFVRGEVHRFVDGRHVGVDRFDPVEPL